MYNNIFKIKDYFIISSEQNSWAMQQVKIAYISMALILQK